MKTPLILTAFGTTSAALASYKAIESYLEKHLPDMEIYWAYSSRVVAQQLKKEHGLEIESVALLLEKLWHQGYVEAVVQSLHLFPSHEFHKICVEARASKIACCIGLPLFCSPQDYSEGCDILAPFIDKRPDSAVLIVGHGTDHPSWTGYLAFEHILQRRFGTRVTMGTVEKYPNTDHLPLAIAKTEHAKVYMIPFFFVAGRHYRRDMMGSSDSWKERLEVQGLEVDAYSEGLGTIKGTAKLILRHIQEAIEKK